MLLFGDIRTGAHWSQANQPNRAAMLTWRQVDRPEHWRYSSARNYLGDAPLERLVGIPTETVETRKDLF